MEKQIVNKLILTILFLSTFSIKGFAISNEEGGPLHFVFREFREYQKNNPSIEESSPSQVAAIANALQCIAAERMNIEKEIQEVDPQTIENLSQFLDARIGYNLLMRHGEQKKNEAIAAIKNPALQKIAMMRLPNNLEDPLTLETQVELLGSLVVFDYLLKLKGLALIVESSINMRSLQVAYAFSVLFNAPLKQSDVWNCLNYPPAEKLSNEELLKILPDGLLSWDKKIVDLVVGEGTYEKLTQEVNQELDLFKPQTIRLIISHTQQLNIAELDYNLPLIHLKNYGIIAISQEKKAIQFAKGVYN